MRTRLQVEKWYVRNEILQRRVDDYEFNSREEALEHLRHRSVDAPSAPNSVCSYWKTVSYAGEPAVPREDRERERASLDGSIYD